MGGDSRILEIVLRAVNQAKPVLDEVAKQTETFGTKVKETLKDAVAPAAAITGAFTLLGKKAIDTAASYEQNRIAFETMLGSADKAKTLLEQLSTFAAKTPFDLPQVVDGAKRLSAYGIEAEKIIPTFEMLGNIAAGVGTEKLPQLILAFGQVKAATKLTGAELRQFSEAGVPLLEALVNQANATGGAMEKVGGLSKTQAKKLQSLTASIVDQEYRQKLLKEAHKDTGVSYQMLEKHISDNKKELQSYGTIGEATYKKVKVSAEDMIGRISDGSVKFEDVQKALSGMTSEGGKFYDLMERQSATFSGVLSNTRDELVRFTLSVMGVDAGGDIREGSIFAYLKKGAEAFLQVLQTVRPYIQGFVDSLLQNKDALIAMFGGLLGLVTPLVASFIAFIAPALAFAAAGVAIALAIKWVIDNFDTLKPTLVGIAAALTALGVIILISVIPAFFAWAGAAVASAVATLIALGPIILIVGAIGLAAYALYRAWTENWGGIREKTQAIVDWVKNNILPFFENDFGKGILKVLDTISGGWISKFSIMKDAVNGVVGSIRDLISKAESLAERAKSGLKIPGFADGGWVNQTGLALVHQGEFVMSRDMLAGRAPVPGSVTTNNNTPISIGPVYVSNQGDIDGLTQQLAFMLKTGGRY